MHEVTAWFVASWYVLAPQSWHTRSAVKLVASYLVPALGHLGCSVHVGSRWFAWLWYESPLPSSSQEVHVATTERAGRVHVSVTSAHMK